MSYYANADSNGNIIGYYTDSEDIGHVIPTTAIPITDVQWKDSMSNQGKYIVQKGQLVLAPPIPDETQFENAQNEKLDELQSGYLVTIQSGFTFTVGTSTYTMGWQQDGVHNDQLHLSMTQMAIDKGIETFPVPYADINGNPVSIPDQTTLTALDTKANSFSWNQLKQWRTLSGNVKSLTFSNYATLQDGLNAINAIVWTPATY